MKFLRFLKPGVWKLHLFAGFAFLSVVGAAQTYAFIDDVPGVEKPPLYEQLRLFDFWLPWLLFTAPLHFASALLCGVVNVCRPLFSYFPDLEIRPQGKEKVPQRSLISIQHSSNHLRASTL